jgi:cyanophycin synthetase
VGRAALNLGRDLLMAAINNTPFDVTSSVDQLHAMVDDLCLGPSTSHIVDAAISRSIPFIRLSESNLVQLGYGAAQRRIWTAETDQTSAIAEEIACDKDLTKTLLEACGVPVPRGALVRSAEAAWEAAQSIGTPVVIKPLDGNHGRGVSLDLRTESEVHAAYDLALHQGDASSVIVEKHIHGNEHRLLVVDSKVVAAAAGDALWIEGDGVSDIDQLARSQINTDPRRGEGEKFPLNLVKPSESGEIILELDRVGLTPRSVPAQGRKVLIQRNGNVAFDVTDKVHPSIAQAATLSARVVGLDIAGIDMVLQDISQPLQAQGGAVVEVNASPGLLAHLHPAEGEGQPVGQAIVSHLFRAGQEGRIPVVGITGTQRTGRIARLVAWLIHISGKRVGLACSEGLYLGARQVEADDCARWEAGQRVLMNRSVQAAVIENPSAHILGEGLAYDKCAVGLVTDVTWQPALRDFDIQDTEQTFKVARTQVDVVLPSGCAVLNAADAQADALAELCDGRVMFYGLDANLPALAAHRDAGERVVFLRDGAIELARGATVLARLPLSMLKPAKAAQPEMVMAAVAVAWALDIPLEFISAGLRTFDSSPKKTPY